MSYRRTWQLVDTMNRCWREPLVETFPGSSHNGGGARVTAFGGAILGHYRALQGRLADDVACGDSAALSEAMLPEPKASQKG